MSVICSVAGTTDLGLKKSTAKNEEQRNVRHSLHPAPTHTRLPRGIARLPRGIAVNARTELIETRIRHHGAADVGVNGAEGVIRRQRLRGLGQQVEKRRFSDIG